MANRYGAAALVALLAGGAAAFAVATPATAASEYYAVPASGVFQVTGHGWGHGHGMSQWGAEGAAESGLTAAQIMAESYPGTASGSVAGSTIRVHVTAADGAAVTVWAAPGLAISSGGQTITLPTAPLEFRLARSGSSLVLQSYDGHSWTGTGNSYPATATFTDSASIVRTGTGSGSTDYRGSIEGVAFGSGVLVVNTLPLDQYVQGVVPRESPSSWLPAALQAQAIAARTYAVNEALNSGGNTYDICDTDACQVYGGKHYYPATGAGYELEAASSNAAVAATAGLIRTYGGKAAFTQFSSSDGGYTSDGGYPYLNAHPDPYDGVDPANTGHTWTATLSAAQVQSAFPAVGKLTAIEVTGREGSGDWGGRVTHVVLHGVDSKGAATSVSTTGYGVMNANAWPGSSTGLRSQWWTLGAVSTAPTTTAGPVAASTAPGLVALAPVTIAVPQGKVVAGHSVTVSLAKYLPAGSTGAVVAADIGGISGIASGAQDRLTVAPAGLASRAVPLVTGIRGRTTSGTTLVRLGKGGTVTLSLAKGSGLTRLRLLAAVAPGGVVPPSSSSTAVLGFALPATPHASAHLAALVPVTLRLGSTTVSTPAAGAGLQIAVPAAKSLQLKRGATVATKLGLHPPTGAHRVLVSVVAVGSRAGTAQIWSGTSKSKAASLSLGSTGTTATLVTLPSTSGLLGLHASGATSVTVTVIGWL